MLNTFPDLLTFGLLAPFLLRVALGLVLLKITLLTYQKESSFVSFFKSIKVPLAELFVKKIMLVELVVGILLVTGTYTQISSIIATYVLLLMLFVNKNKKILRFDTLLYTVLIVISFSLLFSGAGAFAFDYPL
ncbi:MAG: putative membrane protein YphA (DoxX/SURF4 family) [Candidatus Paceibacteria bacterium]|jgi:uncharacterized membrane protein YphA (DoxX/SURF4 family)